jgi:PIN domain nuclease of toxin-antitoxin system
MAYKYIVDTHALIWYLEGNPKLGPNAQAVLDNPASALVLPVIALSEAIYIVDKGRTLIPDVATLFNRVQGDPRLDLYPLTLEVLQASLKALTVPEMHDRLIVATGLHLQSLGETVSILTKDVAITDAALLPIIW